MLRANNARTSSINGTDLAAELQSLRRQSDLYETALHASVADIPGEKALRRICKQFNLKQFGNKMKLLKALIDHGSSFANIVNMSGHTVPFFHAGDGEPLQSTDMEDDNVVDALYEPMLITVDQTFTLSSSQGLPKPMMICHLFPNFTRRIVTIIITTVVIVVCIY